VTLDHRLAPDWNFHAGLMGSTAHLRDNFFSTGAPLMPNPTTYNRRMLYADDQKDDWTLQAEITGKITTGDLTQKLLFGVDASDEYYLYTATRTPANSPLNIFNPVYGQAIYAPVTLAFAGSNRFNSLSGYAQDELSFGSQWKLLLGGRYDSVRGNNYDVGSGIQRNRRVTKFSPRGGLTFSATKEISLYASAGKSFNPEIGGVLLGGAMTLPSVGTSYDAGIKTEFLRGKLVATVARYDLKKTNVVVGDPLNPGFSIQIGEQHSKGTELDLAAQLAKGWNLLASYAQGEAKITKDTNVTLPGKRIVNVPEKTASLWSTYEFSAGDLNGFKFGGGLFHVSDRPVNNANLFFLPSYNRYDAMASYRFGAWRVALNVQNVTDKKYFDSAGGVFHPMAPRQFFLNLSHAF
jgi:iron complex outermembrane receptor protein